MTSTRRPEKLRHPRFPRASSYDPSWILDNDMGPNAIWLTEFLTEAMSLSPEMLVLDLGCGKALSSIFLAREFGVRVVAADLWVPAFENAERIHTAGLDDRVTAVNADARNLPFADELFDAIVSVDAFEYFGTDREYLTTLLRHLRPGGQIGVVNAGVTKEIDSLPPEWPDDFLNFHTPDWWRDLWESNPSVEVECADLLPEGRQLWLRWHEANGATDDGYLTSEYGENLGFNRIVAHRVSA